MFGEAEGLVLSFAKLTERGNLWGRGWLQSRTICREVGSKDQDVQEFHRTFCATQQIAARIAKTFNRKLEEIPGVKGNTPRIEF